MTTRKRNEVVDDDGNVVPPPGPDTDVGQLIYLLEWGRSRGFVIGPIVKIGELSVQVADTRQKADPLPAERSIWQEHGHEEG